MTGKRFASFDPCRRRVLGGALAGLAVASLAGGEALAGTITPIDVIGAPSNLGLRPLKVGHIPGARRAPAALRSHRLAQRLGASDRGDVATPAYNPAPDAATGYRNGAGLAAYTPRLAEQIGTTLDARHFALLLGGDCSVLLGGGLALKRRGRYGLLFIDGHSDFYFPRKPRPLSAAGMDLALATGHGPPQLSDIEGRAPYFAAGDTVVFGYRDAGTPDQFETERFENAGFALYPIERARAAGFGAAAQDVVRSLAREDLAGFWIHLDVDVLDPGVMPAVDSPDPGGLKLLELEDVLATALASPRAIGMEVDIYDPDLDADGHLGERIVALLERVFARAGRFGLEISP